MKVTEYLDFCAGLKGIKGKEKKMETERVMKLLGIKDVSGKLIRNLSKGYKQRVGFAQALLGDPKFLILDEPTVGLDPNQVVEVRNLIKSLGKEHSVIFSSHILSEVSAVCDRVVIINKGEIRAIDTIENLEKPFRESLTLHIKAALIGATEGVSEITEAEDEGNNISSFTVQLSGDAEQVQDKIAAEFLKNQLSILEIYTDKPSLEKVFTELINRPVQKKSLAELMDEVIPENSGADGSDDAEEEKEEDYE